MKTIFNKQIAILLVVFFMYACNQKCNHQSNDVNSSCYPNNAKPSQIITYQEMEEMIDAYNIGAKKELDKYLKKVSNGKDSISTIYNWYKIEDLKQYIAYIEKISKEKEIPVTGFRIYPVSYPNNYQIKELRGRQTLIFTPTTTIGDKNDVAFEPLYSKKQKPIEIEVFLNKIRAAKLTKSATIENELESSSANRIQTTPPF